MSESCIISGAGVTGLLSPPVVATSRGSAVAATGVTISFDSVPVAPELNVKSAILTASVLSLFNLNSLVKSGGLRKSGSSVG